MILIKYIFKEIFKNQSIILIVLFFVCFCQKLIKILEIDNNISIYFICLFFGLNFAELGKLIFPLSLFISVLVTCYRLHLHNEILGMYICSVSKYILIKSVLMYSTIIAIFFIINMLWLSPLCEQYRNSILFNLKKNNCYFEMVEKKFQFLLNKTLILFINNIENKKLQHIFIVKKNKNNDNTIKIIVADKGNIHCSIENLQSVVLENGICYEIHYSQQICTDIYITNFSNYQMLINYNYNFFKNNININNIHCIPITKLINSSSPEECAELHWRLTLIVSIFIMPIIALLLMLNISSNYLINFLLATVLYIIFFLLHILLRSHAVLIKENLTEWVWSVNIIYFMIAYIISYWKNIYKIFFKNYCLL